MSKYPAPKTYAVTKTEAEWKAELSPEDYNIIREKVSRNTRVFILLIESFFVVEYSQYSTPHEPMLPVYTNVNTIRLYIILVYILIQYRSTEVSVY